MWWCRAVNYSARVSPPPWRSHVPRVACTSRKFPTPRLHTWHHLNTTPHHHRCCCCCLEKTLIVVVSCYVRLATVLRRGLASEDHNQPPLWTTIITLVLDTLYLLCTGHLLIVIISGLDFSLAFVFCCFVVVREAASTARIAGIVHCMQ